jgi:hypothetical protein
MYIDSLMKNCIKRCAVGLLVVAAAMVVVYRAVNRVPLPELPQNLQVYEIFSDGGCLSCHSADPKLPFYSKLPVMGDIVKADVDSFKKDGANAGMFPERWLPSCFAVLPEAFTEQNGMMNSTMKVVRGKVEKFYQERIDILYTADGKNLYEQHNLDAFK